MATFVLVHGLCAGGWCWKYVTPWLRESGHNVYAPTLTGLGERSHLARPEVDFETHVQDVVNVLEYEDLYDVILLGHSLGGTVAGAVAHRVPERIAQLIYLDAIIPANGRSVLEIFEDYGVQEFSRRFREQIEHAEPAWLLPIPASDGSELGDIDPKLVEWIQSRETPHPAGSFTTPVRLGNLKAESIPRTYIACLRRPPEGLIHLISEEVRADPSYRYREIDAVHDANLTAPEELARLLMEIAQPG